MTFDLPPRRTPPERIVPMINVVFLLLIFFLMTAQITAPDPVAVTPPVAASDTPAEGEATLFVGADGVPAYQEARGDAAIAAVLAQLGVRLTIKADAAMPATALAALLPRLAPGDFADIALITGAP
ncbi:outer membrane transport energization protein ExbD [Loktanella fryxellensis]|uniref:Outer membrane transport energization protein ExbD n=1 Tax=Loktanella fryxellensis TaxID=245187 RepID=A0A1H8HDM5_9RHOB|nr:biopolymer transporter ExbD [Loktanella fryxellensis]SEN54215.1 outer membrane transport energization protein ExbD [Loktanella fryxellensis]